MKKSLKYIISFIAVILIFLGTLTLTSLIPSSLLKENVKESAEILKEEGNKKIEYIVTRMEEMEFDNYTDALMINTAYSIDSKKPLYSALVARKNYLPRKNKNSKRRSNI